MPWTTNRGKKNLSYSVLKQNTIIYAIGRCEAIQAEVIVKFQDLKENKIREIGEQFVVSKERYHELERQGFVKEIKEKGKEAAK